MGNSASGKPAVGLNNTNPAFGPINAGIEITNRTNGVTAIGGNKDIVWTFSADNYNKNQILSYDAATAVLLETYDNSTHPTIPANINVTAIYTDKFKNTWFGLNTNALLVVNARKTWRYLTFPSILPAGSRTNANAITGTKAGEIYIGTTAGLVFYSPDGKVDDVSQYRIYGKPNGLPSNNITGIAYDQNRFKVWVSTDQGIAMWDPLCIGLECSVGQGMAIPASSVKSGIWSDPTVWEDNTIPDSATSVIITDSIVVDINANCYNITMGPGSELKINAGFELKVYGKKDDTIIGGKKKKK